MKVIDKTPYQDEKGSFNLWQRFQGSLEYGFSWRAEVEAQKTVISQLERVLEKGYTLIRNLNLENSKIIEPLILVGPSGAYVLYVTPIAGFFEAKGDEWNVINNDRRVPAQVNLLKRAARLARAVQVYLNRQGVHLPSVVEPILIAANPGVHIESLRPIVRVVLSDGIKQFGASLLQGRPFLRPETVHDVVDHLLNPRPKAAAVRPQPQPPEAPAATTPPPGEAPQRARAIFHAAEEAKPFDPADLNFEFDEHAEPDVPPGLMESNPSQPIGSIVRRRGFSPRQWLLLVVLLVVEIVVLLGFVYLFLFGT